jgi:hypothetical protein
MTEPTLETKGVGDSTLACVAGTMQPPCNS